MDLFRTAVRIPVTDFKLNYLSRCLFIGSCFTESIGNYLKDLRFKVNVNPFGITYNPFSIASSLESLITNKEFSENDLDIHNDIWFSFQHHSRYSDTNKEACLNKISDDFRIASDFIKECDFLFITLGTSYIYTHKKRNTIVANCHKLPSENFIRSLAEPDLILASYSDLIKKLTALNPSMKIVFTISPVRHMKNGFIENQKSKSILFYAIHKIQEAFSNCYYFPAYEIMMDELRDYRFYNDDMLHPNDTAVKYIRKKFSETYIDESSQEIINTISQLSNARNHRIFYPDSKATKDFYRSNLEKINALKLEHPLIDLKDFEDYFKSE